MNWRIPTLLVLICVLFNLKMIAQDDLMDSTSSVILQQLISYADAENTKKAAIVYNENKYWIRYQSELFDSVILYSFSRNHNEVASELLKRNPFLMSQHNEQALYHYYRGISQMLDERGWPNFKLAEQSMNQASLFLSRSISPDYGFYSDVENARGYLAIVARGLSTDEDKEAQCIIRSEFMYEAIDHFRSALIYNPENEFAQRNLDTLLSKLQRAGLPIPPHEYEKNMVLNQGVSLDSINIDSLNDVSMIPVLDYTLLPKNYQLILRELQAYDEIVLLIDLSGSMDDPVDWSNEASKFNVAQQLAIYIALNLRANVFLGAISVGRECDRTSMVLNYPIASVSRQQLTMEIDAIRPFGHTPLDQRLLMTKDMFSTKKNKKLVFLLSDGMDTCGDIPNLCGTAAILASLGIDLSIFSFIYESLDPEVRSAYSIYNCMVQPSQGKIYKITRDVGIEDQIDYVPVSNNILVLPKMDTSVLWVNNKWLYQFPIKNVEPPVDKIMKFER